LYPENPIQILKIFNPILFGASSAYRPASIVSGMQADRFVYSEKGPEFLSVAA